MAKKKRLAHSGPTFRECPLCQAAIKKALREKLARLADRVRRG